MPYTDFTGLGAGLMAAGESIAAGIRERRTNLLQILPRKAVLELQAEQQRLENEQLRQEMAGETAVRDYAAAGGKVDVDTALGLGLGTEGLDRLIISRYREAVVEQQKRKAAQFIDEQAAKRYDVAGISGKEDPGGWGAAILSAYDITSVPEDKLHRFLDYVLTRYITQPRNSKMMTKDEIIAEGATKFGLSSYNQDRSFWPFSRAVPQREAYPEQAAAMQQEIRGRLPLIMPSTAPMLGGETEAEEASPPIGGGEAESAIPEEQMEAPAPAPTPSPTPAPKAKKETASKEASRKILPPEEGEIRPFLNKKTGKIVKHQWIKNRWVKL